MLWVLLFRVGTEGKLYCQRALKWRTARSAASLSHDLPSSRDFHPGAKCQGFRGASVASSSPGVSSLMRRTMRHFSPLLLPCLCDSPSPAWALAWATAFSCVSLVYPLCVSCVSPVCLLCVSYMSPVCLLCETITGRAPAACGLDPRDLCI